MRTRGVVALAAALLALWPAAAGSQQSLPESLYRPGTPPVLKPESPAVFRERESTIAQFAKAYGANGRPRIAVFWNRRFDDRLSDWTTGIRLSETASTELDIAANAGRTQPADALSGRLDADLYQRRTLEASWRRPAAHRAGLPEGLAFELESGFTATLAAADVLMVDRAAAMRLQDRAARSADPDAQRVEADALLSHADLLLEVLSAPRSGTPLGVVFQVIVKDVRTGQVVHSLTSDGEAAAEATPSRWRVGDNGFVRASNRPETAGRIGEQLALETMAALTARWR